MRDLVKQQGETARQETEAKKEKDQVRRDFLTFIHMNLSNFSFLTFFMFCSFFFLCEYSQTDFCSAMHVKEKSSKNSARNYSAPFASPSKTTWSMITTAGSSWTG
jgi:hypothetical protein